MHPFLGASASTVDAKESNACLTPFVLGRTAVVGASCVFADSGCFGWLWFWHGLKFLRTPHDVHFVFPYGIL